MENPDTLSANFKTGLTLKIPPTLSPFSYAKIGWFLLIFGWGVMQHSHAQESASMAAPGTYQLIVKNPAASPPVLTPAQLRSIEKLRTQDRVVYAHSVSDDLVQVRILSKNQMNQKNQGSLPALIRKSELPVEELRTLRFLEIE